MLDERLIAILGVLGVLFLLIGIAIAVDSSIRSWTSRDLTRRADLLWSAVSRDVVTLSPEALEPRFEELSKDDRVVGFMLCSPGTRVIANSALRGALDCSSPLAKVAIAASGSRISGYLGRQPVVVTAHRFGPRRESVLFVVQDRSFLWQRRRGIFQVTLLATGLGLIGLVAIFYFGARATRHRVRESVRDVFRRAADGDHLRDVPMELQPIVRDLDEAVRRARAEREKAGALTGPQKLRQMVADEMPDTKLILVANREPYIHVREGSEVKLHRPASGLVTGVEPLLRACGGVWVAHGSGSADRESCDARGRLPVPPSSPEYVLRRVWLSPEEEDGYYYGFANEGLWPLCHIAHTRPTFRASDWAQYQKVNRKFALVAAEEAGEHGLFLIQDYHFALASRELRSIMPQAVIGLFWHIPWPNDEVVGICPWRREILAGMLGADVVGFHTRYHCLNFLDTVARYVEARVDFESMSVEFQGRTTRIKPYPISVQWPYPSASRAEGTALRQQLGIPEGTIIAVGVDRADYTKGLPERVTAVETLLTEHPELIGKFVLFQVAAPTRTRIKRYGDLASELEEAVVRVNRRFGSGDYRPVILRLEHFEPDDVRRAFAMADLALVTPLHDGMNLVAKEYVASCEDGSGALVLSEFTGAAKELGDALLVNPYDSVEVAQAIYRAATMPDSEKRERMARMRAVIEKQTIFDWSAALLRDLAFDWERRHVSWADTGPELARGRRAGDERTTKE